MKLISIIIPSYQRAETLIKILASVEMQTYPCKEVIVIDDNSRDEDATKLAVQECKKHMVTNVLYLNTGLNSYGLAKARNMGVCEAMGEMFLFMDDRYILEEKDTLEKISKTIDGRWHYGKKKIKGKIADKKAFIENFSWIHRKDFRGFGCFNERINMYGGMSQDVRERLDRLDIQTVQHDIYCTEICSSKSSKKREQIWRMKYLLKKLNK